VLQHQPRYVADDLQTLKLAVLAGTGMSFLPESMSAAERQAQLLVPVLPGWALPSGWRMRCLLRGVGRCRR
jgi:DNA-binding transcriptional LysR family regulator